MKAEQILFSQGFGTRHECRGLILLGKFTAAGMPVEDPDEDIDTKDLVFTVDGTAWPYYEKAIVMMNKPEHYECSLKPLHHPSVISRTAPFYRRRQTHSSPDTP